MIVVSLIVVIAVVFIYYYVSIFLPRHSLEVEFQFVCGQLWGTLHGVRGIAYKFFSHG